MKQSIISLLSIIVATGSVSAAVVVDFDELTGTTLIPPTFTSSSDPSFDLELIYDNNADVQFDDSGAGSGDYGLRFFRGAAFGASVSFTLSEGGLFDFSSFDLEQRANTNSSNLSIRSFLEGSLIAEYEFFGSELGNHDLTAIAGFTNIDEIQLNVFSISNQFVFDNFTFNLPPVPEPVSLSYCAAMLATLALGRKRRMI